VVQCYVKFCLTTGSFHVTKANFFATNVPPYLKKMQKKTFKSREEQLFLARLHGVVVVVVRQQDEGPKLLQTDRVLERAVVESGREMLCCEPTCANKR